jgi:preprotein translocase subunit YajC
MDIAFAQAASQAVTGTGTSASGGGMIFFIQIIAIMALFYFLMIHPQKKEKKKKEDLLNSIQRGDKVLTRGGLYGTVSDIKENVLVVKIAENTKIEIERSYVENVQKNT